MTKTIYPSYGDYNLSVANLSRFAREPRLVQALPQRIANGNLVAYSGGYSRVYPVESGRGTFALRCWTADLGDARERYRLIGDYLGRQTLSHFVEFEYLDEALVVKGRPYPVLWMEWAEGPRLREFVGRNLSSPGELRALAEAFREMVASLHAARISHGDLQDENIIVQQGPDGLRLRLIDYDSLFVPALGGYTDQIIGISHYQHPRRNTVRVSSERVDHFSELVIYLSLLVYAERPELWDAKAEKRMLFADSDFADPDGSPVFRMLRSMTGDVRRLADRLLEFCGEADPRKLEPLEATVAGLARHATAAAPMGTAAPSPFPADAPALSTVAPPARFPVPAGRPQDPFAAMLQATSIRPQPVTVPIASSAGPPASAPQPASSTPSAVPVPQTVSTGGWAGFYVGANRTATAAPASAPPPAVVPAIEKPVPPSTPPAPWRDIGWVLAIVLILVVLGLVAMDLSGNL
jgi:serine/threonine protein kinase